MSHPIARTLPFGTLCRPLLVIIFMAALVLIRTPAVRAASTWYVATDGNDANSCQAVGAACRTIQAAINKAAAEDSVNIAAGTYTESLNVGKSLSLVGVDAASTIIDGGATNTVMNFMLANATSTISRVTIRNGKSADEDSAGGINQRGGTLNIRNSIIRHNVNPFSAGGGIASVTAYVGNVRSAATLNISNSMISDNTSKRAGGGILADGKTVTISNSTIINNTAGSSGGGIYTDYSLLTVSNSTISGNSALNSGGGVFNYQGEVTLTNSTINGNSSVGTAIYLSDGGGGISNMGTLVLNRSIVRNNTAVVNGGGIHNQFGFPADTVSAGSVTLTDSIVRGNIAGGSGGGMYNENWGFEDGRDFAAVSYTTITDNKAGINGGGIANMKSGALATRSNVTLRNSTIANNSAGENGGGINNNGTATIRVSTIANNSAGEDGGGISSDGTVTITESTLSSNTAAHNGGAILNITNARLTLTNTTLSSNIADGVGGGLSNQGNSTATFNNVTIAANQSVKRGGGINSAGGTVTFANTILATNTSSAAEADCAGWLTSEGYNLVGNATGCTLTPTTGDQAGTASSPINPRLGPLQDNGGSTLTHMLLPASPAIDAGNPAEPGSTSTACVAIDQRNQWRPYKAACDIGAVEQVYRVFLSIIHH